MQNTHRYSWLTTSRIAIGCAAIVMAVMPIQPADAESPLWSEFQNGGSAVSPSSKLPLHWTPETNVAWTAKVPGYGQSAPVVAHDQVVVTSTSGDNKDNYHLVSYAIESGEQNWQLDFKNPSPFKNTPMVSRAAPTAIATENGFVAFFEGGVVVAVSAAGERQWELDLVEKFGAIEARHGLAASLEQDAERLFVWVERSEDPYILALDKTSGEVIWKVPGLGTTSWASPRLISVNQKPQLVCSGSGKIVGLDPGSGAQLWEFTDIANNSSCTPMPVSENQFLIGASDGRGESSGGSGAASNGLIEISENADGSFQAAFKWQAKKATSTFGSPVVAGRTAAIVNRTGVLFRIDLESGEQVAMDRVNAGGIWATPIVNGDLIYVFGHKGTTSVVSLTDGKEIATNRCWAEVGDAASADESGASGGKVLYAAAVASPYLIIRSGDELFAIKE